METDQVNRMLAALERALDQVERLATAMENLAVEAARRNDQQAPP